MAVDSTGMLVRTPRVRAEINEISLDSITHMELASMGSFKSSHFELTVATNGSMKNRLWLNEMNGRVVIKILMRLYPGDSYQTLFEGLGDGVAFDSINNNASIWGRDFSSVLINSSYQASFCNQTASDVANSIASRHGFLANITATSNLIGGYLCGDYNQVLLNAHSPITSEWDLLTYLARIEGFELFVDGTTLVFSPLSALSQQNIPINNDSAVDIKFNKTLMLSNNDQIVVKSWNAWLGQLSQYTQNNLSGQASSSDGLNDNSGTEMAVIKPNLTPQGAQQLYQRCLNLRNEHVSNVEITMPGELNLWPHDVISVSGSRTDFDADYTVGTVRRQYSSSSGFIQHVQGFLNETGTVASQDQVLT